MAALNVRMSEEELARVDALRERLQKRADVGVLVTQRIVVLRALETLEAYLDKLDRERGRPR